MTNLLHFTSRMKHMESKKVYCVSVKNKIQGLHLVHVFYATNRS